MKDPQRAQRVYDFRLLLGWAVLLHFVFCGYRWVAEPTYQLGGPLHFSEWFFSDVTSLVTSGWMPVVGIVGGLCLPTLFTMLAFWRKAEPPVEIGPNQGPDIPLRGQSGSENVDGP